MELWEDMSQEELDLCFIIIETVGYIILMAEFWLMQVAENQAISIKIIVVVVYVSSSSLFLFNGQRKTQKRTKTVAEKKATATKRYTL